MDKVNQIVTKTHYNNLKHKIITNNSPQSEQDPTRVPLLISPKRKRLKLYTMFTADKFRMTQRENEREIERDLKKID